MRTLRQLDNEVMKLAKNRAEELCGESDNYFGVSKNEIIALQASLRFGDKYREMHAILKDVEKFLAADAHEDPNKQKLLERIAKV